FREFYPEDCFIRNFIFETVRRVCHQFCFLEYDAPILEPLELFTEKSGEEIVGQLFNFTDRGGRAVALRPEMTPSVARMVGSKIHALKRPLKWFSIEENFRYERPQKGRLRSFYQFNVDIFDEPTIQADGEIIALAIAILQSFGLSSTDFHLRLSDRQLWTLLLQSLGVAENQIATILSIIDKIEDDNREEMIQKLDQLNLGGAFLLEKIQLFRAIRSPIDLEDFFASLGGIREQTQKAVALRLEQMKMLLTSLEAMGLGDFITIDFSIVRGLAYYTGFVFEIFERSGKSRAIAGGGRYDELIEKSGYPRTAAVGLAIGDVVLTHILAEKNLLPSFSQKCDLFVVFDEISKVTAMGDAYGLRRNGFSVAHTLKDQVPPNRQLKQGLQWAHWVIIYQGEEELLRLKDVIHRRDYEVPRGELIPFLLEQRG
ncbi:MAG: ATP phosphoribosyltransferase regulatory subunit, partial [Puniceicoccales bacterium]|nr:ATP phosphoribosyltransferase regulatory subunit [Puniceicoccales bacterium]